MSIFGRKINEPLKKIIKFNGFCYKKNLAIFFVKIITIELMLCMLRQNGLFISPLKKGAQKQKC